MNLPEYLKIGGSWYTAGFVYVTAIIALVLVIRYFPKISSFIGQVKGELVKASWPWDSDPKAKGFRKYKELIDSTVVVLIAVILLAGFVQFWDFLQVLIVGFLTNVFR